jgi:pyruvate decarboxylase
MQYGSIGWSVGATLGYAQAAKDKRVIACIGDGSFQVSNIIRKYTLYSEHLCYVSIASELIVCLI